ncbi:uncharacterized protein LOC120354115 [Nilaparvata lugens]|uniref:uncharacterized protein LOC120354114 n=1 Tax=Nilaparvata lugens TaxID=108931 RepID=UPI000B999D78|nr:uncharacterized protein LOC120354114 [Nilaparvata lugens]XP_039296324.1 uncharacterized protein LOC120354115 [Nilaparvata lugens]
MNCRKCTKLIVRSSKDKTNKVQCSVCKENFHGQCLGLSDADLNGLLISGRAWMCADCACERRRSRSHSDGGIVCSVNTKDVSSLDGLKKLIHELGEKMDSGLKRLEQDLGKSLDLCHEKLDENSCILATQQAIIDKQNQLIESLRLENLALSKKVTELSVRLDDAEQYSRSNTLEIYGVPVTQNEDVSSIIKEVGKALDVAITEDMIDACHRLKQQNNRPSPGIIVRFVRRAIKEKMLERRRVKRTLSTRHIGMPMDTPVYINQSLCPARRILFAKTKRVKNQMNFKFLWVDKTGNIKIRRDENSAIHLIKTDNDITKLAGSGSGVDKTPTQLTASRKTN